MAVNKLADQLGISYDQRANVYYEEIEGYAVLFGQFNGLWSIVVSVTDGKNHDDKEMSEAARQCKAITRCNVSGSRLTFIIKGGVTQKALVKNYHEAADFITEFLKMNDFENCCEYSRLKGNTGVYYLAGNIRILNSESYEALSREVMLKKQEAEMVHENIALGILGTLGGSLIGAVLIVLIARLGFVSIWSGVAMGFLAMLGYEKLGGKLSVIGIIVSAVIMVLMTMLAHRMDWAIEIASALKMNIFEAFGQAREIISYSKLDSEYTSSLFMMLLFTAIGAVLAVVSQVKSHKNVQKAFVIREPRQTV